MAVLDCLPAMDPPILAITAAQIGLPLAGPRLVSDRRNVRIGWRSLSG
jgi:hypothetical protein